MNRRLATAMAPLQKSQATWQEALPTQIQVLLASFLIIF